MVIDLMARQISYEAADGGVVRLDAAEVAALFAQFAAAGGQQITIGSRHGDGFALHGLQLEVWSDLLLA